MATRKPPVVGRHLGRLESHMRQPDVFYAPVCGVGMAGAAVDARTSRARCPMAIPDLGHFLRWAG